MRKCIKCGGSALRDYAWGCEHDFGEAPDPEAVGSFFLNDECMFMATGKIAGMRFSAEHPTREGAVALWKERWRWGPAIAALFGWLCERPSDVEAWDPEWSPDFSFAIGVCSGITRDGIGRIVAVMPLTEGGR